MHSCGWALHPELIKRKLLGLIFDILKKNEDWVYVSYKILAAALRYSSYGGSFLIMIHTGWLELKNIFSRMDLTRTERKVHQVRGHGVNC